jgi:dimethylaniline monooxygenase (N-oxide forming)
MARRRTVAVVGGGPSGLAAAKAAGEFGLRPTVFEAGDEIGGVWGPGGAAWPDMATNLSRFTCAFSDHPWEPDTPDFPTRRLVHRYLRRYAEPFLTAVRTGCPVERLEPADSGWLVRSAAGVERFDAAIVASGVFSRPFVPALPGAAGFRGRVLHSAAYRSPDELSGHRVVVVGAAFSGAEIGVRLAACGAEVTLVASRPMWMVPRRLPSPATGAPVPLDLVLYRRWPRAAGGDAERRRARALDALGCNPALADARLRIDPDGGERAPVAVADGLAGLVRSAALRLRVGRAVRLAPAGVLLDDGSPLPADAIVWCTGYELALPFLPRRVLRALRFAPRDRLQPVLLHLCTFPPGPPGLAFVGVYRGPFFGVIELQARWACAVLAGACPGPAPGAMAEGLAAEARIRAERPRPQFPHGDYVDLADRLAAELGVLPDPEQVGDGPVVPAQYRLRGPHANPAVALPAVALAAARARG